MGYINFSSFPLNYIIFYRNLVTAKAQCTIVASSLTSNKFNWFFEIDMLFNQITKIEFIVIIVIKNKEISYFECLIGTKKWFLAQPFTLYILLGKGNLVKKGIMQTYTFFFIFPSSCQTFTHQARPILIITWRCAL